jgi:hypothetical protein
MFRLVKHKTLNSVQLYTFRNSLKALCKEESISCKGSCPRFRSNISRKKSQTRHLKAGIIRKQRLYIKNTNIALVPFMMGLGKEAYVMAKEQ